MIFVSNFSWKVDLEEFPIICRIEENLNKIEAFEKAHPNRQVDCPEQEKIRWSQKKIFLLFFFSKNRKKIIKFPSAIDVFVIWRVTCAVGINSHVISTDKIFDRLRTIYKKERRKNISLKKLFRSSEDFSFFLFLIEMPQNEIVQSSNVDEENLKARRSSSSSTKTPEKRTSSHRKTFSFCFSASDDRTNMVTYWKRNSNPNLESMMLDTNADKINRFEYPEILECLPDLDGKKVLELGAGIGFVFSLSWTKPER